MKDCQARMFAVRDPLSD